jgi:predicted esterase
MEAQRGRAPRLSRATLAALLITRVCLAQPAPAVPGLHPELIFSDYPPEASAAEIVHRLLTPLAAAQVERTLEASHQELRAAALDLASERFTVFVPALEPAAGYALLVFIPPWPRAQVPPGWQAVLEHYGTIFVSAAGSGNEASDLGRRAPLALVAVANLRHQYRIDAARIYVGGFSGGARVALRLALAYPEVFHGALLNAGSDPIDAGPPSPPAAPMLQAFQRGSRIVYVTGEEDKLHLKMDADSQASLRRFCQFDYYADVTPKAAHEVAGAAAFGSALHELGTRSAPQASRLHDCNAALETKVSAELERVSGLIAGGRRAQAQAALIGLDRQFGGLAAPRSVELESELGWQLPASR